MQVYSDLRYVTASGTHRTALQDGRRSGPDRRRGLAPGGHGHRGLLRIGHIQQFRGLLIHLSHLQTEARMLLLEHAGGHVRDSNTCARGATTILRSGTELADVWRNQPGMVSYG